MIGRLFFFIALLITVGLQRGAWSPHGHVDGQSEFGALGQGAFGMLQSDAKAAM